MLGLKLNHVSKRGPWTTQGVLSPVNTSRPRQNGWHFTDDTFNCIFLNENVWISIKLSLKFVFKGLINDIPALVQIMSWHRPGTKPLYEPMMAILLMHICVTWAEWANYAWNQTRPECPTTFYWCFVLEKQYLHTQIKSTDTVTHPHTHLDIYRKISNIRPTKSPNLTVSVLVLQLSLPNPMKPGVKLRMKM